MLAVAAGGAADHRVGIAAVDGDGGDGGGVGAEHGPGEIRRDAVPFGQAMIGLPVVAVALVALGIYEFEMLVRARSEEHTSELQSLMRISYAVFCLKKKKK